MFIRNLFSQPLFQGLALALVTNSFLNYQRTKPQLSNGTKMATPKSVEASEVFSAKDLKNIGKAFDIEGDKPGPEGQFVKGRHGFTHYVINGPADNDKGMIVLATGIGTDHKSSKEMSDILVSDGFSTLRYDYFGHGYSKYDCKTAWLKYDPDMFVDQLEDMLEVVSSSRKEKVTAIVGHSTGGIAAIYAAERWNKEGAKRGRLPKIALLSPALWAEKPLLADLADYAPTIMGGLLKMPGLIALIGNTYLDGSTVSFARTKATKESKKREFLYPKDYERKMARDSRLFGKEKGIKPMPYFREAIYGINENTLRNQLLKGHRASLERILRRNGDDKVEVLFAWGDFDETVPFTNVETAKGWERKYDNFELSVMEKLGHECLYEDTTKVVEHVLPFLQK